MYTIKFLAPFFLATCANDLLSDNPNFCEINPPKASVVKYYEPEKSCYVNGAFYSRCGDYKD